MKRVLLGARPVLLAVAFASCHPSGVTAPEPARKAYVIDTALAKDFIRTYPRLGAVQGFDGLPFSEVPDGVAALARHSERVTPVEFPVDPAVFAPNKYVLYSMPCPGDALAICHYLGVTPNFGMPQHRIFGPVSLP
ncbi:hypothetical protein PV762_03090 [Mitsuaria sp. CC2]|uniref:hypothetical protein n=1 Tax=Mitsuaria sp. CC2 TaxID=3029186 RepID=UPI003B8D0E2E